MPPVYYAGVQQKLSAFQDHMQGWQLVQGRFLLVPDVDAGAQYALHNEIFGPMLAFKSARRRRRRVCAPV